MSDTAKRYIVDWSGNTGLAICPICGERTGPYFTREETALEARTHYQLSHHVPAPKPAKLPCSEPDCDAPRSAKGLCNKHYQRDLRVRKGIVRSTAKNTFNGALCREPDCTELAKLKRRCTSHYRKAYYAAQQAKAKRAKALADQA